MKSDSNQLIVRRGVLFNVCLYLKVGFIGIPIAEKFSFCIHTLLSDIAARHEPAREEIITTQVECLIDLTTSIKNLQEQNQSSSQAKLYLCKITVPVLIGLARALGRFALSDPSLICRLFPKAEPPIAQNSVTIEKSPSYKRSFSNFRSIIPRSLSGNLTATVDILAITQGYDTTDVAYSSETLRNNPMTNQNRENYDSKTYFFAKFGSSFNQFPHMKFGSVTEKKILFPQSHLQTILAMAKKLLTKETLNYLDEQSLEVYSTGKVQIFPYKTFSETVNLVMVTLLRELLQPQKELPTPFTKDVQEFVKGLFLNGQTELQSRNHDASEKEDRDSNYTLINKFKLNVMANAACVDLLVWAIGDETGEFFSFALSSLLLCFCVVSFLF